ncbi:hypothetical protein [Winogradskyella sp. SYSU M77433]|uniref:hypothetical protein n=1 Tax=Winogradskyella sp. SYSU M77433 TaxID=3042722 RepID=UPI002480AB97|nr:hypothetical protein [Winogradskyella sp. SYSU M77433]MDH7914470.1 hypothetical protein [Winogradskyella sp. SYSU M77433]
MNYKTDKPKFHEEVFKAVSEIVEICFDYLSDEEVRDLEVIYAMGIAEEDWLTFKPFYHIKDELLSYGEIKDKDDHDSQIGIQMSGTEFLIELIDVFKSYDQETPKLIKIQYYSKIEKVEYQFEYDLKWSNSEHKLPANLHEDYFEEIKNSLESK